jgi:CelD/BcsL family acetyltransferase involved in cellulose biosynthesis
VARWEDLRRCVEPWDDLVDAAIEPNVFYSSFALLPAMQHLKPAGEPRFLVVRASKQGAKNDAPVWTGFFPFVKRRRYRGFPVETLQFLHHDYCFLRAPLVRGEWAAETLGAVFEWLRGCGASLVEWADQPGDGRYAQLLADQFRRAAPQARLANASLRALLLRARDADECLRAAVSGARIKELRRLERRVFELGDVHYDALGPADDLDRWIDEFLDLEASGWKGRNGTAIAARDAHREFFVEMAHGARRRDRLRITALRVRARPIAMLCNLLAPPGSFAFKTAYSEEFASFSPGRLIEVDNLRRFHAEASLQWMDSCAEPGHPMIERLWRDRRWIHSWLAPLDRRGGCIAAALPLLQWVKRGLFARPNRNLDKEPTP